MAEEPLFAVLVDELGRVDGFPPRFMLGGESRRAYFAQRRPLWRYGATLAHSGTLAGVVDLEMVGPAHEAAPVWCEHFGVVDCSRIAELETLLVHPAYRRRGLARNLVAAARREAEARGLLMVAVTDVGNGASLGVLGAGGFTAVATMRAPNGGEFCYLAVA